MSFSKPWQEIMLLKQLLSLTFQCHQMGIINLRDALLVCQTCESLTRPRWVEGWVGNVPNARRPAGQKWCQQYVAWQ